MRLSNHHFDNKVKQAPLLFWFFAVRLCSHAMLLGASAVRQAFNDTNTNALNTMKTNKKTNKLHLQ